MQNTPEEPIKASTPIKSRGLDGVSDAIQELAFATRNVQKQQSRTDAVRQRQTKLLYALIAFLMALTLVLIALLYIDIREGEQRAKQNEISRIIDTEGKVCEILLTNHNESTEQEIATRFKQCLDERVAAAMIEQGVK